MKLEDLILYQVSSQARDHVYELSKNFPPEEKFSLTDQIRRSTRSITANISEGYGRFGKRDTLQFLYVARGSIFESLDHLVVAKNCKYINEDEYSEAQALLNRTSQLLSAFIRSIKNSSAKGKRS